MYTPRPWFQEFHEREKRFAVIVAHRRAGKTVAAINDIIHRAILTPKKNGQYAYIAPFRNQAETIAWKYLREYSDQIAVDKNEAKLMLTYPNGAEVRLFGADNPDALRGPYFDGVILDEYADMDPSVWEYIILPALSDRRGWALFIGTPRGHDAFYDKFMHAQNDPMWYSAFLPVTATSAIPPEEIALLMATMDEDAFAQEYLCSFDAANKGSYYGKLINAALVDGRIGDFPYLPDHPVHTAWDLGWSDDTSIWFYQQPPGEPTRVIDFAEGSGLAVDDYMDILRSRPYVYGMVWLPHDGFAKTVITGRSVSDQMRRHGLRPYRVPDLTVQQGIQATRDILKDIRFNVNTTAAGLEHLKLYSKTRDKKRGVDRATPRHDSHSHAADAFRYLALAHDMSRQRSAPLRTEKRSLFKTAKQSLTLDYLFHKHEAPRGPFTRI